MRTISISLFALTLLATPTFFGASVTGERSSVRAEEVGVGVRVEGRDRDRDRDRQFWRRDRDDDARITIKKRHHRDWDDD